MRKPQSLRARLVLIVVALMAVVGAVVGAVSVLLLQEYLVGQVDAELRSSAARTQGGLTPDTFADISGQHPDFGAPGQASGTITAWVRGNVFLAAGYPDENGVERSLTLSEVELLATVPFDGAPHTIDLGADLGEYRVLSTPDGTGLVLNGLPLASVKAVVGQLALVFALVTAAGVAIAAAVATFVVGFALRPLHRVASTAASVAELPLDRGEVDISVRVPERYADSGSEVGKVGAALNRLLGQVGSALAARQRSEDKVRRFVADASHELRTPLASIRGYSELTRRVQDELPPEVEHNLGRIESEAVRMTSLVEDLLLLARLDSQPELRQDEVDLSIMVVEAVGDAHAAGPDHEWMLELPEEPVTVIGDDARLRQVLVNLLANARIHTPAGTRVTTSLEMGAGEVVLRVSDSGPGVPEEAIGGLFERFSRGDTSRTRATGSTGLGLSIVKAVTEAHGGSVEVDSEPGATSFIVRLPATGSLATTG